MIRSAPARTALTRRALMAGLAALAACGRSEPPPTRAPSGRAELNRLIDRYADRYDVPRDLVHRMVRIESNYNPRARNGPNLGLMQIQAQTARTMGFRGRPEELFDAETNLRYAVKYLRGAWIVARGNREQAIRYYQRGYYYDAKRMGLLKETGLA